MHMPEPMVLSSVLQVIVDELKYTPDTLKTILRKFAIPSAWLTANYQEIPLRKYVEFFEEAAILSRNPNLGLELGRACTPYNLGPVGLLFASSPDLGRALHNLTAHVGAVQDRTISGVRLRGNVAYFEYRIDDERIREKRQDAEFSLAVTCQMVRFIAGRNWVPEEVHFEHPAPASVAAHASVFKAPVYFDQNSNLIVLKKRDLTLHNPQTDERMAAVFQHHAVMLRTRQDDQRSLGDQVRGIMRNHLPSQNGVPSAKATASATGLSTRTLQRMLKSENSGFRAIKDDERQRLAFRYLGQTSKPITEIAIMLGYADAACFTRACQRWFGASPRQVRRDLANA